MFWSTTPPSIVCVAPWKKAEPESCADRQSGAFAPRAFAGATLLTLPLVMTA